jgi:hypothetical protein
MPDYDLAGLSPRSFEQLIQAIALKVISPQTIIFGDGTDGGREASYRGKTHYLNEAEPWDGYIVFQAKFRQRPDKSIEKDGDWAISQLKKELEDFADPQKGRNKPEYYIFATNVVLTPMLDKGSKDKAYKLFENFKDTVPLKGYDIWDYDKIARFLDDCPEIRRSYAAWITSGDVLAEVIKAIHFNRPDFETVISNFLQKELLSDLYANLEQAGNFKDDKIPLASVFVDLPFANRPILEAFQNNKKSFIVAKLIDSAKQKLDPESLLDNNDFSLDSNLFQEIQKHKNIGQWVVIGGPGQGKTTVSQFLCQLFRVAILKDKRINNSQVVEALSNLESQCQKETIALPTVRRFPIRIILNDFAAKLASQETTSLLDYITQKIRKRTNREIVADDLRLWLATYPWLIILDGLDEVPASSNRKEVLDAIRDFWIDANDVNADIMVIATTRPQGYNEDFGTDLYNHVWLTPLSSKQALHYASRLVELRYGNDSSRQETINFRLERAAQDDSTTRLMQSPLQVTIMTVLCDRLGQPPKDRWKLFKTYYQVIYEREVERDIPASTLLREYQADIESIHYQAGLLLQVESERSGKTDARLSEKDFTTLVRNRLEDEGHEGKECEALTKQIIEAAANRLVFLVGLEQNIVGFEIRSLQEFMASEAITNGSDEQIKERLEEIIPIISWRNVVLFAIGKCFFEKEHLRHDIHSRCAALNDNDNDIDGLYNATLAGSRLALDILEDGVIAKKPTFLKLFARLALNLLDLPPDSFHIQLADVYEDSLETIYKEEIEKRISHQNYQQYLGAWTCLFQLINLNFTWAIELAEKYCLQNTNEKNIKIIAAFIKQNVSLKLTLTNENWIASLLIDILPNIDPLLVDKVISWKKIKSILDSQSQEIKDFTNLYLSLTLRKKPLWLFIVANFTKFLQQVKVRAFVDDNILNKSNISLIDDQQIFYFTFLPGLSSASVKFLNITLKNINTLKNIDNGSNTWSIYIAIADFIKNPSSFSLSQALKSIAQNANFEFIQFLRSCNIPWQIGECLEFIQNNDELLLISERAEKGELGNREDWQKAEERWEKTGISKEDFTYLPDNNLPFSKNISKVGYPFLISFLYLKPSSNLNIKIFETSRNYSADFLPILTKLIALKANTIDKRIRERIVLYILSIIIVDPEIIKKVDCETIFNDIKQLLVNERLFHKLNFCKTGYSSLLELTGITLSDLYIYSFMIMLDIIDVKYKSTIIEIVNEYGKYVKKIKFPHQLLVDKKNLLEKIVAQFNQNSNLLGFLRIISFLDISKKDTVEILATVDISLLEPNNYEKPEYQVAAIIVSLCRTKKWSNSEIDVIAGYAADLIEEHPRILTRILDMIEQKHFSQDVCESFLIKLKNKIPKSEWQQLNRITRLINEQLSIRISSLSKKSQWSRLGLPQGANSLLPEELP